MIEIHNNGQWSMQKSKDNHKYQKDWIIPDRQSGHLWCLAIASNDNKSWCIIEWVNERGLSPDKLGEMVDIGYMTMLEAMKNTDYEYIIAQHRFAPEKLDEGYWKGMMGVKGTKGKVSIPFGELKIDKDEFEKEVGHLVKQVDYRG